MSLDQMKGKGSYSLEEAILSQNTRRLTSNLNAEQRKVMRAMETSLQKTAMKIVNIANGNKEQIPPITTSETNPFPYQITLNPRLMKAAG